jgi:hypothetical protein
MNILYNFDFTLTKYEKLCRTIIESKYSPLTLTDYLLLDPESRNGSFIIMRHDIDRTPQRALDIAKVEHQYNIHGVYYFRVQRGTYVPEIIDKISSLSHEIGYHYETLDKSNGNIQQALDLFRWELADFRKRYDVKTVCAHGNPLTNYDNKDILKSLQLADLGLLGEAFLALDYSRFAYFSDSGRTWIKNKSQKMPGKDEVFTAFDQIQLKSTDDAIRIIKEGKLPNICILTHPERWTKDALSFTRRYLFDMIASWGKVAIYAYRSSGTNK